MLPGINPFCLVKLTNPFPPPPPSSHQSMFQTNQVPFVVLRLLEPILTTVGQRGGRPWMVPQSITAQKTLNLKINLFFQSIGCAFNSLRLCRYRKECHCTRSLRRLTSPLKYEKCSVNICVAVLSGIAYSLISIRNKVQWTWRTFGNRRQLSHDFGSLSQLRLNIQETWWNAQRLSLKTRVPHITWWRS